MGRLEDLETELNDVRSRLGDAASGNRKDDIEKLTAEMDRLRCELHTYEDTWVPETTDTDYNELGQ